MSVAARRSPSPATSASSVSGATTVCIIAIAVLLGFSDTGRLREFSYPFIAQMLMLALLWGLWFDQLVAAILYWRDRRAVRQLEGGAQ